MDMEESPEEFIGSNHHHHGHILLIKGKRTRRQRPSSPISVPAVTTTSSSSGGTGGGGDCGDHCSIPCSMASCDVTTYESTTEEEADMANCLILLAQSCSGSDGGKRRKDGCGKGSEKLHTRKFTDKAASAGLYGYECNTCNKTFTSFQALGGHRASHKRPKTAMKEEKKPHVTPPSDQNDRYYDDQQGRKINKITTTLSLLHGSTNHRNKSSSKVHECSICGSEFSSGQALGGHMRRHRSLTSAQLTTMNMDTITNDHQTRVSQKRINFLPILDLNLPAPDDDDRDTKFPFTVSNQSPLVFSSPALVDCHY